MKTKTVRVTPKLSTYLKRVAEFPLVSIRTEAQLRAAQQVIDQLLTQTKLDAGEQMYLDALSDLVATYEEAHYPIAPAADADMLKHLMDARGITQSQLHRDTDIPKSTISEILSGKKPFSRTIIRTLADYFQVNSGILAANL
ncbi:MAG: helix-turn-helix domain-containing protein [Planctomycetaceae bacterium]|nr:helix-turn-helix domain-containing protein [Planctomycetaceae bacterium]